MAILRLQAAPPAAWPRRGPVLRAAIIGAAGAGFALAALAASGVAFALAAVGAALAALLWSRAAEHARDAERLYLHESAVVHAKDAIIILAAEARRDRGRSVLYVNAGFTQMTGYTADEVVGRSLHILRGPKTDPAALNRLREALATGRPLQTELLNYRKDGSEVWVDLSLVLVEARRGRRAHWVMIQRDISERKYAEAALTAREEQLRALGDNLPGGAVYQAEWDARGRQTYTYISAGIEGMLGLAPAAILADGLLLRSRIHPDDLPRLREAMARAAADLTALDGEFRFRDAADAYRTLHCRAMPAPAPGGGTRWDGVLIDATERKQLEESLRHAHKMETVGQLAGGIAHDFNNLLTGVIGGLALVTLPEGDPNAKIIAAADRAAQRAADLTRKLLGFARKNQLLPAPMDVAEFAQEVVDFLRYTAAPRVQFATRFAPCPQITADAALLNQVLMNLLLNARDAMPGGGTVTVAVAGASGAALRPPRAGEFARLSVADTGHGMAPEVQAKVFEPFFTTKPVGKGTGLGLAMVQGIVHQHGGWVECESAPGAGTTFHVYLPVTPPPRPAETPPTIPPPPRRLPDCGPMTPPPAWQPLRLTASPSHSPRLFRSVDLARQPASLNAGVPVGDLARQPASLNAGVLRYAPLTPNPDIVPALPPETPPPARTVLVVDDEEMIRLLGRSILESAGFTVLEAEDGAAAVELYRERHADIDLVILDLMMPTVSGRDAFRQMTAIEPTARVLFSSGYSTDDLSDVLGAAGLLAKPYRPPELLHAVGLALGDGGSVPCSVFRVQ